MNITRKLIAGAGGALVALLVSSAAIAYETPVHGKITETALDRIDAQRDILSDLGILPSQRFNGRSARNWMIQGSISEDDFPRSLHHFFDPTTGSGLSTQGLSFGSAADWALDASGNPVYSIPAARESMYKALTNTDPIVREKQWADTFRAVGQFTHLLQDMAQPQHVRNDPHLSFGEWTDVILPDFSRYERYTLDRFNLLNYGGPYPSVQLPQFRHYWSTGAGSGGKGLADFTNGNFVSQNTNFEANGDSAVYPSPSFANAFTSTVANVTVVDLYGATYSGISIQYFGNNYVDGYLGQPGTNDRLTASSVFDDIHRFYAGTPVFTLTDDNNQRYSEILIPRAVGYSAGLINNFFRGRMQISLPDDGVYALVDHSAVKQTDPAGSNGFNKVKLKLSAPATGNDSQPQTLSGGTVVAVFKFRRNTCWKDDLTGEPPKVNFDSCRGQTEELVVSAPANGGSPVTVSATPLPLEFNFGEALPLNATDVRLQVVYRGALGGSGSTENDAVVVATQDVSEPTFFSYMNASDYYTLQTPAGLKTYTRDEVNDPQKGLLQYVYPQSCVDYSLPQPQLKPACLQPFDVAIGLKVGTTTIDVVVPPKRLMRFAYIGDGTNDTVWAQKDGNTCYPHDPFEVTPLTWQLTFDPASGNILYYPDFDVVREVPQWYGTSCVGSADTAAPGTPDDRDQVMAPLSAENKVPFPVQINGGNGF